MQKFNKIKSVILSGMIAAASVAGSFASVAAPSLSASAAGSDDYAKLLQYSLYFYDANMCGDHVGERSALSWRDNCHTGDEVKGGYHDAGDHAMFGLPQGFTASVLGWSYYEFKDAYNATGQAEHLKVISDHFSEFFKASTKLSGDTVTNFLYQKEDGDKDHKYWGRPENQENVQGKRKMFWASNGASDIAADYAASLALSYINFGNEEDLKYAKALYKFSTQYNQVATEGTTKFYKSSGCTDEQANAAGWLYIATGEESYKNDCASKQTAYLGWADGWDNRGLGAACVYAHITGNWNKVNSYIQSEINSRTPNGYTFFDKWGSARLNASFQFTALVASKNSSADFTSWAKGQMNYLTGDNPANTCFVVGFANNSAKNPHHRAASGYNSYDEFNGSENVFTAHSPNGHSLIGALVGGPTDANGTYTDNMNDYVANEVAIDYNAGLVGASAGLYELVNSNSKIATSIPGVTKIYNGSAGPGPIVTPPTPPTPSGSTGLYETKPNKTIVYSQLPADDKMIGFKWEDLAVGFGETVESVEFNISASGNIGKWEGAFGSSTSHAPDYWVQSSDMSQTISGNSGTIVWKPTSDQAKQLNTTSGDLKFGVWWIDCGTFTIDSIVVKTDKYNGSSSTTASTKASSTSSSTTRTTTKTTTTTTASPSTPGVHEVKPNYNFDYGKTTDDTRMVEFKWEDFNIGAGETINKVEVNITSKNGNIGKWQGAFGTSTSVQPDYWYMTDEMSQTISGNNATITWNIDPSVASIIQTKYGGNLKFGTWWVDCQQFTIDSVKVYTSGGSTSSSSSATTTKPETPSSNTLYGDANCDGKIEISDATLILQFLTNKDEYKLSDQGLKNADVYGNNDGVTAQDALVIQQVDAGIYKASQLPIK